MPVTLQRQGSLLLIQGLDTSKPGEYISEIASPRTQNFFVDKGILTKRAGTTLYGTSLGSEIMQGIEFARSGTRYNVRVGLVKIQSYSGGAWNDIQHASLTGSTDNLVDIAIPLLSGKQILVFTNSVDVLYKWTGSGNTAALGGTPPKGKFVQEYQTYLVVANITGGVDVDNRVQWSDTASPETWTGGNSGAKDLVEDGGDITGMGLFGNYLCIHKLSSIYLGYLVSTSAVFRFERKATGAGTCANNTIVNLPTGEQIFLATDGLRIFNGITASVIDSPVNDEIRDGLNAAYRHKSWAVLVKELDEVWIGLPIGSQTAGETIYKFNYVKRVCYKDSRSLSCIAWRSSQINFVTWDNAVGTWDEQTNLWDDTSLSSGTSLIFIGETGGNTTYVNSLASDDNGTAINAFWETKDFESPDKRICRWMELQIWAKGGTITVEYSTDGGASWVFMDASPYTLTDAFPTDDSPLVCYFDTLGSKIRFRFSNAALAETLAIKQFIVGYKNREFRR